MQQTTRRSPIDAGFHALGYAFGATLYGTVAASWWAIKKSGQLSVKASRACMKIKMPVTQRKLDAAAEQPNSAFFERAPDLGGSTMLEQKLADGSILRMCFYPKAGVVRRRLIKDGKRVQMDDMSYSDKTAAIERTLDEIKQGNKPVLGTGNTAPVIQNSPVPSNKIEPVQKQETHIEMRPPKKEVSYRGVLAKCGIERREDVSSPYDCYCIHLADQLLGVVNKLWGTDLQRAVQQSGVEPGDAIEVSVVGETPVFSGGKTRTKKVWSIVKLK
jgi:hypothetical protein